MKAIFKKEIKAYFLTAQAYVFIGVFLIISGYFFVSYNILSENSDVGTMLDNTVISFVFLIPVLTMRLFAEEKHLKTNTAYMSSPLGVWQIVTGKFLAAAAVFALAVAINLISAVVMLFLKGQSPGEVFCVYTGFLLTGFCFIAVGMFVSSLTSNQIVSAIASFCICFLLYLADWALGTGIGEGAAAVVKMLAVTQWYQNFLTGIFDLTAVIYFVTFTALFISFTVFRIESERL